MIPGIKINRHSVGSLYLISEIFKNSNHPLLAYLPKMFQLTHVTRCAVNAKDGHFLL